MNDGNQSGGDWSIQDIYNDFEPATAELPAVESQSQSLDLSGVPDAPDGYGLPQQVDAITPESSFAPASSGIEEFTQYDGTYFDDVEHVTEQTQIGAMAVPDEFDFGADDNGSGDQHVRFIDERPQGALNGRVLAIAGAVGCVLIVSLVVGYTFARGGDVGSDGIVAADGSKEDELELADQSDSTVAQSGPSDVGALEPNVADLEVVEVPGEAPQDPASPITVASSPLAAPSSGGTTKPSPVTTADVPVTTVDVPVTTVDVPVTTVDVPVTTVDVSTTVDVATVSVPDVVGLTVREAQGVIEEAGLVFSAKIVTNALDADGEPLPNNYVISSDPETGEKVEEGEAVTVFVNRVIPVNPPLVVAEQANP